MRLLCPVIVALLCQTDPAWAQSTRWVAPPPSTSDRDWIRLTSGDWISGEIEELRDRNFEFDSDELDMLKLDWDDVAELRSSRRLTYRFDDLGVFTGTAIMRDGIVVVRDGDVSREFPRAALLVILGGEPTELNFWSMDLSAGFVGRSGNTDQADINSRIELRRHTPRSRLLLRHLANVGQSAGEENINNQKFVTSFDVLVTAGLFVTVGSFDIYRDRFQNIDYRITWSAGVGYSILRDGDVDLSISLGAGHQNTRFVSVEATEEDSEKTGSFIPSTDIAWEVTNDVDLAFEYDARIGVPAVKNTFHHARSLMALDLFGDHIDLELSVIWDRNETPQPDSQGNVPKRDDFRTVIGIGVDI